MLARSRRLLPASSLRRGLARVAFDDCIPMSIADRAEADAVKRGSLSQLSGRGKPLKENTNSQAHILSLSKNMEGRAEAEMRRAVQTGMLRNLAGEGEPLDEERQLRAAAAGSSGMSVQDRIQDHVRKSAASS